ncbi:MAG: aspartate/glutamate racemase family protein [Candidatus Saliniplasma sp.]
MRIKIVEPVITKEFVSETEREVKKYISKDTDFDVERIKYGTASIESSYDEYLCAPNIIKIIQEAEEDAFHGAYINCFGDPGLEGAREVVDMPVVGAGHTSIFIAAELCHRFSIITPVDSSSSRDEAKVELEGLSSKVASVRSVDITVLDMENKEKLNEALIHTSKRAVLEDGAHGIVLGCTGMVGLSGKIDRELKNLGYYIPIIHPVPTSIRYLEMLINLGLTQSEKTYMKPTAKERNILELFE